MSNPTRYELDSDDPNAAMEPTPRGDYVSYDDYAELETEIERLKGIMEKARDILNV